MLIISWLVSMLVMIPYYFFDFNKKNGIGCVVEYVVQHLVCGSVHCFYHLGNKISSKTSLTRVATWLLVLYLDFICALHGYVWSHLLSWITVREIPVVKNQTISSIVSAINVLVFLFIFFYFYSICLNSKRQRSERSLFSLTYGIPFNHFRLFGAFV